MVPEMLPGRPPPARIPVVALVEHICHQIHVLGFEIPKWLSLGLIVVIFGIAFFYARRQGPVEVNEPHEDDAADLLMENAEVGSPSDAVERRPVQHAEGRRSRAEGQ